MTSPYFGKPETKWKAITERLLAAHPLKTDTILDVALSCWTDLWQTSIGSGKSTVQLQELEVPATVVGYFFEVLFAKKMENRFPGTWRGGKGSEKDLVNLKEATHSVEIKMSGQRGYKVYGNRSYGQRLQDEQLAKKDKSGYYMTVNFFRSTLTLIRFGWIDASDWKPQKAPTGQMAGLPDEVYRYKLVSVSGAYQTEAPVGLLHGVGPKIADKFATLKIHTIGDLLKHTEPLPAQLEKLRTEAVTKYQP